MDSGSILSVDEHRCSLIAAATEAISEEELRQLLRVYTLAELFMR
jgi:hypothetical protein